MFYLFGFSAINCVLVYALQHGLRLLKREQGPRVKKDNGKSWPPRHRGVDVAAERTAADVRAQQAHDAAAEQAAADEAEAHLNRLQTAAEVAEAQLTGLQEAAEAAEAEEAEESMQQSAPSNSIIFIKPTRSPLVVSSSYGPIPHKRLRSRWTVDTVDLTA